MFVLLRGGDDSLDGGEGCNQSKTGRGLSHARWSEEGPRGIGEVRTRGREAGGCMPCVLLL